MATASVSLLEAEVTRQAEASSDQPNGSGLWAVVLPMIAVAAGIRLLVAAFSVSTVIDPGTDNHGNFGWEMAWTARSIVLGHGFSGPFETLTGPTALVPPVFPYLLAAIFKVFGLYTKASAVAVLALNCLFSALTCLPVYLSTRESLGPKAARWAGWAWVVYPYSIYFSAGIVWDFALTSLLFATCFWLALRLHRQSSWASWLGYGLACGVAGLSNPSILPVLGMLLLLAGYRRWRLGGSVAARVIGSGVVMIAVLVPWSARNYLVLHTVSPVRDGFWLEAYAGNAGDSTQSNPPWAHPASNPAELKLYETMGEKAYMAQKHELAAAFIAGHPAWFAEVTVRRIVRFWTGFWSFSAEYRQREPLDLPNLFLCVPLTCVMLLGAFRWARANLLEAAPYLIAAVFFPLPYYVTHASMDYREPIESIVVVLAIAAFVVKPASARFDHEREDDLGAPVLCEESLV